MKHMILIAAVVGVSATTADAATTLLAKGELYGTITGGYGGYEYWNSEIQDYVVIGGDLTGKSFQISFVVNSTDSDYYCSYDPPCQRGFFQYDLPGYEHARLFNTSDLGWQIERRIHPSYAGSPSYGILDISGVSVLYPYNNEYARLDLRFGGASPTEGPLSGFGKLQYEYRYGENSDMDIRFKLTHGWVVHAGANVPEPAAWAMMIAGFGLVGGVARRRRGMAVA